MNLFGLEISSRKSARLRAIEQREQIAAAKATRRYYNRLSNITAANVGGGRSSWMGMPADEDAANKQYAEDRMAVMQRSQDLHANNPDVSGFHCFRTAQVQGGPLVRFRNAANAEEVGVTPDKLLTIRKKIDRYRTLHSKAGGFDSQFGQRREGTLQARAILSMYAYGCCLIHRVWKQNNKGLLPLAIELIPGSRISTPFEKQGDPLVSFGIRYTDELRREIVGFYVRRVSSSLGNSFVINTKWDFLPAKDCTLISLIEPAGIDQSLPICTSNMRTLRNRGEFIESMVEAARAQSKIYGVTTCAKGQNPYLVAEDDNSEGQMWGEGANIAGATGGYKDESPIGFVPLGDAVQMLYNLNGMDTNWASAKLPEPELEAFLDKTDERLARGYRSSKSAFTRKVNNSWAGGRLEQQQDTPVIGQDREVFCAGWDVVNGWFIEALWLTGLVELPGYSRETHIFWNNFHAQFDPPVDINPDQTASARVKNMMTKTTAPQLEAEANGGEHEHIMDLWIDDYLDRRAKEKARGVPEGYLDILFPGRAFANAGGQDISAPAGDKEEEPGDSAGGNGANGQKRKQKMTNGHAGSNGHARLAQLEA